MNGSNNDSLQSVALTALMVAFHRTFSDIPYSQEIYDYLKAWEGYDNIPASLLKPGLGPQFEARYKLIGKLLKRTGITQVLEIAAGFSPRGIEMVQEYVATYVELDRGTVIGKKRELVSRLVANNAHLYLEEGDGLNLANMEGACGHFKKESPVAIINEGLMRYLSFGQKEVLATNVRCILKEFGGVWITPDISLRSTQEHENKLSQGYIQTISESTGVNIVNNRFDSVEQAKAFFENLGFDIEQHSFLEVTDELVSPKRLNISRQEVEDMNGTAVVFVIRLKD